MTLRRRSRNRWGLLLFVSVFANILLAGLVAYQAHVLEQQRITLWQIYSNCQPTF